MELVYGKEKTLFLLLLILAAPIWLGFIIGTHGTALIYIAVGFLFYLFAQSGLVAYLKGSAVVIGPGQFPDLCKRVRQCAQRLDVKMPTAFLLHGNGAFNAFATRFLGKDYIVLLSDVVDALEDRPEALDFYIGHELGHIKRNHLIWATVLLPVKWLPLLGAAYARACESTCDRHGLACCARPEDACAGLAAQAAGGKRWKTLEPHAYAAQASDPEEFWLSFHELCSDYPWLSKRMSALLQLAQRQEPQMPRRNPLAYLFALFVPRVGVAGGTGTLLVVVALVGILAAIAVPAYQQYKVKAAATSRGVAPNGNDHSAVDGNPVDR
ncbi:MAG: peptidase M48 family protein, partial [Methylococcaceae bacterium]|nr:peptidase M48 family protein [Methylococcaceae bacterium]